jgi:predicted MFS family arabinose efflux permease
LIGGLLVDFCDWRAIFWFIDIYSFLMILIITIFVPETCRNIVGNGAVPPQRWNKLIISLLCRKTRDVEGTATAASTLSNRRLPSLIASLHIIFTKEAFVLLVFSGLQFGGFYILLAGLPQLLETTFKYNSIQVGLCYIPMGAGIIVARQIAGLLIDVNFRRHAKKLASKSSKGNRPGSMTSQWREQDLRSVYLWRTWDVLL